MENLILSLIGWKRYRIITDKRIVYISAPCERKALEGAEKWVGKSRGETEWKISCVGTYFGPLEATDM